MSTFWRFASLIARRHARQGNPLGRMAIPLFAIGPAPQTPQLLQAHPSSEEVATPGTDSTTSIPQMAQA